MSEQDVLKYDYPMVRWLGRAFQGGATSVLDVGGSVGNNYYSYSQHLKMPSNLKWSVVEDPGLASIGQALAGKNGTMALHFSADLDESVSSQNAEVWILAGATRYFGNCHPALLLQRSKARPKHILVNNLPLHWDEDFVAVQNLGQGSFSPVHVYNRSNFIRSIENMGYILCDAWDSRELPTQFPCYPDCPVGSPSGLYFLRRQGARYE